MALSWVVAGGGTGGHVTPALALAEQIAERGDRVVLVGSESGLETRIVPQAGFDLVTLRSAQVMGRGVLGRLRGVLAILREVGAARRALREAEADIVVSVGGFAAMPVVLAARITRTPLVLVEPNAMPGRVNRLSARFAARVFVGFDETAAHLSIPAERVVCHGIPLRRGMLAGFGAAASAEPAAGRAEQLLVFGGSQGARQINEAVMDAYDALQRLGLRIFHQTGVDDEERVRAALAKSGLSGEVVAFEPEMPRRYHDADLAICRAGAFTIAELCLAGLPAVLVPYPFAADDHQRANAMALERAGAAVCLSTSRDEPLTAERLLETVERLLGDPDTLRDMARAARELARPEAAHDIVRDCAALLAND